jgi:hypothetical protein
MEFQMASNTAIKNAARRRQDETGESYTEARAAVVAKFGEPITIRVWFPEMVKEFELDTPEARKAWRELDKDNFDDLDYFAEAYLGNDIIHMGWDELEEFSFDVMVDEQPPGVAQDDPVHHLEDAKSASEETRRTITPEQYQWLLGDYDGPVGDDGEVDLDVLVRQHLPAELATSAILARYASALAGADPATVEYRWPRSLLVSAIDSGFKSGTPLDMGATNWPTELGRVKHIMECATVAGDVPVLHECIGIFASWLKILADWTVNQPDHI